MIRNIPELPAERTSSGTLRVWCPHCKAWHRHGGDAGHRAAHCLSIDSPFWRTGYVLVVTGEGGA